MAAHQIYDHIPNRYYTSKGLLLYIYRPEGTAAKFLVPDWGEKVDSGVGLHWLAGWYDNPLPESTLSLQSETTNLAAGPSDTSAMVSRNLL